MKSIFYDWGGANEWLFHLINSFNGKLLDKVMALGSMLGSHKNFGYFQGLVILYAIFSLSKIPDPQEKLLKTRYWFTILAVFNIAYMLDGLFLGVLKPLLNFPRPPLALPSGSLHIIGEPELKHRFPSGHASFAMVLVASFWPVFNRCFRTVGIFFVVWVCLSRISVGAHFPADVLGGALSSLAIVLLVRHRLVPKLMDDNRTV
mgnify:CR=1 FL=1